MADTTAHTPEDPPAGFKALSNRQLHDCIVEALGVAEELGQLAGEAIRRLDAMEAEVTALRSASESEARRTERLQGRLMALEP